MDSSELSGNPPWFFDATSAPGWHDWFGILLAVAGFSIAIYQIREARLETTKATKALNKAQARLSSTSLLASIPQIHLVVADIDHSIATNNDDVAHRALVRYAHVASEASRILDDIDGDHVTLSERLKTSATAALDSKAKIVLTTDPDVSRLVKAVSREINAISLEMTEVASVLRNNLGGKKDV